MSTESFAMSHEFIDDGHQLYLIAGIDPQNHDGLPVPFATEERGEWWWVVESSQAEAERTRAYLVKHVPARPLGWRYTLLPCTMDDLLKLRYQVSPRPVGFIHHVGWEPHSSRRGRAIPAGLRCDRSKTWDMADSESHGHLICDARRSQRWLGRPTPYPGGVSVISTPSLKRWPISGWAIAA